MSRLVKYPLSLPTPQVATIQSVERRVLDVTNAFAARSVQSDRLAIQQITFVPFLAAEVAIFEDWWENELSFGGLKFAATWPLPQGFISATRQFLETPKWERVHGYWQASVQCEVLGRGLPPTTDELITIYTSWPYPIFVEEALDLGAIEPVAGQLWVPPIDELDLGLIEPLSGDLYEVLHDEDAPPEELDIEAILPLSGTLELVLHTYDQPPEELDIALMVPLSGTLETILVTYEQPPEELDLGVLIPLSGTLE